MQFDGRRRGVESLVCAAPERTTGRSSSPADARRRVGIDPQRRDRAARAQRDRRRADLAAAADRPRPRQSLGEGRRQPFRHRQRRHGAPDRPRVVRRSDRPVGPRASSGRRRRKIPRRRAAHSRDGPAADRHRGIRHRSGRTEGLDLLDEGAAARRQRPGRRPRRESRATSRRASWRRRCATARRRSSK